MSASNFFSFQQRSQEDPSSIPVPVFNAKRSTSVSSSPSSSPNRILASFFEKKGSEPLSDVEVAGVYSILSQSVRKSSGSQSYFPQTPSHVPIHEHTVSPIDEHSNKRIKTDTEISSRIRQYSENKEDLPHKLPKRRPPTDISPNQMQYRNSSGFPEIRISSINSNGVYGSTLLFPKTNPDRISSLETPTPLIFQAPPAHNPYQSTPIKRSIHSPVKKKKPRSPVNNPLVTEFRNHLPRRSSSLHQAVSLESSDPEDEIEIPILDVDVPVESNAIIMARSSGTVTHNADVDMEDEHSDSIDSIFPSTHYDSLTVSPSKPLYPVLPANNKPSNITAPVFQFGVTATSSESTPKDTPNSQCRILENNATSTQTTTSSTLQSYNFSFPSIEFVQPPQAYTPERANRYKSHFQF